MPLDIATLGIAVDSRPVTFAEQSLNRLTAAGGQAEAQMGRFGSAASAAGGQVNQFLGVIRAVQAAFVGLGAALAVQKIIQTADAYNLLQARINLVSGSVEKGAANFEKLFEIAQETRTTFEGTGELFARVGRFTNELGVSQQQVLQLTKTIQQAIVVSGASLSEATSGVIQFSQALASGVLRGDEARSVLENMPRLAQAIAAGMGVTFSEFVTQLKNGGIEAGVIIDALLEQGTSLEEEFAKIPPTVGQAFTTLNNAVGKYISDADDATTATESLARAIIVVADNFEIAADIVLKFGGAVALLVTARAAAAGVAALGASMALVSGPLAAIIAGAPLATVRILAMGSAARVAGAAFAFMGGWVGLLVAAVGLLGFAIYREMTAETELQKTQRESADILQELKDLNVELATAEGDRREQLLATREEIVQTAEAELALARARLVQLEVRADPKTTVPIGGKGGAVQVPLGDLPTDVFGGGELEKRKQQYIEGLALVENLEGRILTLRKELADTPDALGGKKNGTDTGKIKEQTSALESYIDSLRESAAESQLEAANIGKSTVEKAQALAVLKAMDKAQDDYNKGLRDTPLLYQEEIDRIKDITAVSQRYKQEVEDELELQKEAEKVKKSVADKTLLYAERLALLEKLLAKAKITQDEFNKAVEDLEKDRLEDATDSLSGITRALDRYIAQTDDKAAMWDRIIDNGFRGAEDAIVDFVTTGKLEIDDLFGSIVDGINRLLAQELLLAPLAKMLKDIIRDMQTAQTGGGGSTSSSFVNGIVSVLGSFLGAGGGAPSNASYAAGIPGVGPNGMGFTHFGGPRAEGGSVNASNFYLVGEAGPEQVTAPGLFLPLRTGYVHPNPARARLKGKRAEGGATWADTATGLLGMGLTLGDAGGAYGLGNVVSGWFGGGAAAATTAGSATAAEAAMGLAGGGAAGGGMMAGLGSMGMAALPFALGALGMGGAFMLGKKQGSLVGGLGGFVLGGLPGALLGILGGKRADGGAIYADGSPMGKADMLAGIAGKGIWTGGLMALGGPLALMAGGFGLGATATGSPAGGFAGALVGGGLGGIGPLASLGAGAGALFGGSPILAALPIFGILGLLGAGLFGKRAHGGHVLPGQGYMVNELGRERTTAGGIFFPTTGGHVTPANSGGAPSVRPITVNLRQNIVARDAGSFRASAGQTGKQAQLAVAKAMRNLR